MLSATFSAFNQQSRLAVTLFSNRSASYAALGRWIEAADDGKRCISIDDTFIKGYFRTAYALKCDGLFDEALLAVKDGLAHDPDNGDLQALETELLGDRKNVLAASKKR